MKGDLRNAFFVTALPIDSRPHCFPGGGDIFSGYLGASLFRVLCSFGIAVVVKASFFPVLLDVESGIC